MSYQERIEKNHARNGRIGVIINRIKLACARIENGEREHNWRNPPRHLLWVPG